MFFSSSNVDKVTLGYKVFPAGKYNAVIKNAELKQSQAGAMYLKVQVKCFAENGDSCSVFENMNINHPKEQVKQMAQTLLANIAESIGKPDLATPQDLIGGRFTAVLRKYKDNYDGSFKNSLQDAKPVTGDFNPEMMEANAMQSQMAAPQVEQVQDFSKMPF